jgi:hypothetical protein
MYRAVKRLSVKYWQRLSAIPDRLPVSQPQDGHLPGSAAPLTTGLARLPTSLARW